MENIIKTLEDYFNYMSSQKIYPREKPENTIDPMKEGLEWSYNPEFGSIKLTANINGPIKPTEYTRQTERIGVWLKESFILSDSWDNAIEPDRGGHNQSLELRGMTYQDIKNDPYEKMYQNLVEFAYYLINFIKQGVDNNFSFEENQEYGMDLFKDHFAIQNACWFPHLGNKTNKPQIIDWMIKRENEHAQILKVFNPTLILGTGTIKPQDELGSGIYHAFKLTRQKIISRQQINKLIGYDISCVGDDSFIMSDGKLYVNIYHPSASGFSAEKIARGVAILYQLHKSNKLMANQI
ncbi:MAG: hypothetical protein NC453_17615 [Muribaculum sp.]|nr:hypothetical protein [Muribaculum sp.]